MDELTSSCLNYFDEYVMNEIPIRLIRLSDMKFVGRIDVKKLFRSSVYSSLEYSPSNHIRYAMLSHRWLDEGEPTYEEMKTGTAAGPGYEKLQAFCQEAEEYGVEFAWSDTCCIDNSSSTELDESIRSMFRWYKTRLFDEWTERGWTLQELLAPRNIKFFNARWMPMTDDANDKEPDESPYLLRALEEATGIPHDVLTSDLIPSLVRVDERMAWAAGRQTTRVEDAAYSLMGIFNVSLRIAYGEGRMRAFCRLIEAITRVGDPSVLNWTPSVSDNLDHMSMEHYSGSRAIPACPANFKDCRSRQFDFDRPLEMTMTSLGLRMPVVILPLILHSISKVTFQTQLTLRCPFCPTIEFTIIDSSNPRGCQYAFGIVNYSIIGGGIREVLGIRGRSAGVVLFRRPESLPRYQPPNDIIGLNFASPPQTNTL
ncbi:hypothetical protein DEU56DRAFT_984829 [Suillus clintonianus]|uniref:uncharacterized protein n=1 Tax=Suillus clintonianus TaxID=1904413 RepID=UPI001B87AA40|nr:uncharacterized protein DEU56DRAFT_984829 [Suillus clintonianus]KAG2117601.1 hypothetical protein DEU56DRAFT_984829 [Suillus clintonianus]